MKVLLLKFVKSLGSPGAVVEVKDGYAMNFLIPRGLATTDLTAKVDVGKKNLNKEELAKLATKLKKAKFGAIAKANEDGKLFSAVSEAQILRVIQASFPEIPDKSIKLKLSNPIKQVGIHKIEFTLGGVSGKLTFTIKASPKEKSKKE